MKNMRDIKFRAWDGEKMRFPNMISFEHNGSELPTCYTVDDLEPAHFSAAVMQYTGLKDKNGKEIYEGDILKAVDPYGECEKVFPVEFANGAYQIHWSSMFNGGDCDITTIGFAMDQDFTFEVIGNIYTNPELLTKERDDETSVVREDAQGENGELKQSPRWVKASERLPNHHNLVCVRYQNDYYSGLKNHDSANQQMFIMRARIESTNDCEWLDESESPGSQEAVESILSKLVDIRNKLYNSLPTGEINAWDLLQMVKWHINDLDGLCSRIKVTV